MSKKTDDFATDAEIKELSANMKALGLVKTVRLLEDVLAFRAAMYDFDVAMKGLEGVFALKDETGLRRPNLPELPGAIAKVQDVHLKLAALANGVTLNTEKVTKKKVTTAQDPETKQAVQAHIVWRTEWTEFERDELGCSQRPDGVTYAFDRGALLDEVARQKSHDSERMYTRNNGTHQALVNADLFHRIENAGGLLNTSNRDMPGYLGKYEPR